MNKITVAISGGVDSAVAMLLLQEEGYAVEACHLLLCKDKAEENVVELCEAMRVPLRIIDMREAFEREVVAPFYAAYAHGETPNPCAFCNPRIKFGKLLEAVDGLLATGHYVEMGVDPKTHMPTLVCNCDATKDQSYFLYALTPQMLQRVRFPLAGKTRAEVVALAQQWHLPIPEQKLASGSQDICFLPEGDYRVGLALRHPETQRAGDILNPEGKVLGRHAGLGNYTRGQRRGIGVATGGRAFVTHFDREKNTLTLGPKEDLYVRRFTVRDVNWLVPPTFPLQCQAVSRYHHSPFDVMLSVAPECGTNHGFEEPRISQMGKDLGECCCTQDTDIHCASTLCVEAHTPQYLVTPGQACVFYRGPYLLGGGLIEELL